MSGSSLGNGDQGIDQILAQIRMVIAAEPQPAKLAGGTQSVKVSAAAKPALPGAIPSTPPPRVGVGPVGPAAAAGASTQSTAMPLARHSPPAPRPLDDLSDLIETTPPKAAIKPAAATPTGSKSARGVEALAAAPSKTASTAKVSVPSPLQSDGAKPATVPPVAKPPPPVVQAVKPTPVPPAAPAAPMPAAAAPPAPVKTQPAANPIPAHAPATPPLLGDKGGGGKAPVSLASLVANGTISMPSGVPASVQPPDIRPIASSATAMPSKASSALGDLAAGLAATGQAAPKVAAIPAGLEDKILEGLRPTVRQWLEANAETLAKVGSKT